ncbi:hypothetical protein C8R45DRAFT_1099261 [Mycena sanguinolenta]|nr:hypothetical protein C8R45DRAFT_1099261 [Mycena sanguinolenta]
MSQLKTSAHAHTSPSRRNTWRRRRHSETAPHLDITHLVGTRAPMIPVSTEMARERGRSRTCIEDPPTVICRPVTRAAQIAPDLLLHLHPPSQLRCCSYSSALHACATADHDAQDVDDVISPQRARASTRPRADSPRLDIAHLAALGPVADVEVYNMGCLRTLVNPSPCPLCLDSTRSPLPPRLARSRIYSNAFWAAGTTGHGAQAQVVDNAAPAKRHDAAPAPAHARLASRHARTLNSAATHLAHTHQPRLASKSRTRLRSIAHSSWLRAAAEDKWGEGELDVDVVAAVHLDAHICLGESKNIVSGHYLSSRGRAKAKRKSSARGRGEGGETKDKETRSQKKGLGRKGREGRQLTFGAHMHNPRSYPLSRCPRLRKGRHPSADRRGKAQIGVHPPSSPRESGGRRLT